MKPLLTTIFLFTTLFFATPALSNAAEIIDSFGANPDINTDGTIATDQGFVPCSGVSCTPCHVVVLFNTVLKWFMGIAFLIFAFLAMKAGVSLVTSGGNPSALSSAKSSFTNAFIGLIIILAAWLIVDTLMRNLLDGGKGEIKIADYGPWASVKCDAAAQATPGSAKNYFEGDAEYNPYTPPYEGGGGAGGGSCSVVTDVNNPCHPSKLAPYFGARANQASQICNMESGGKSVLSKTDRCCGTDGNCSGSKSFSGGFFQINILANGDKIPGCKLSQLYNRNGSSPQGNPIKSLDIVRNGVTIHTGWTCEITNEAMYNTCMKAATDPTTNFTVAKKLFDQRGFQPWTTTAKRCSIPY